MYLAEKSKPFYVPLFFMSKVFRFYPASEENKKIFIYTLCLWSSIWIVSVVNNGYLILTTFHTHFINVWIEDVTYFSFYFGIVLSCFNFGLNYQYWSDLFHLLTNCEKYGKPPKFEKARITGDYISKLLLVYFAVMLTCYGAIVFLEDSKCEEFYQGQRVCGLFNPIWWPSNVPLNPKVKLAILLYQIVLIAVMSGIFFITVLVYQSGEFIGAKLDHLKILFEEICETKSAKAQIEKLSFWAGYHQHTFQLCKKLNTIYIKSVGSFSLFVPVMLACFGYQLLKSSSLKWILFIGGYLILISAACISGQQLENYMENMSEVIYFSKWYECDLIIQRHVHFILLRTQIWNGLTALPVGKTNHVLLLAILKATYSYLAMLNRTM